MTEFSLFEVIVGIFSISVVITGGAIFFTRYSLKSMQDYTTNNLASIETEFKNVSETITNRINDIYKHINDANKEMISRLDRQVDSMESHLRDVNRNIERVKGDLHSQEKEFLRLRADIIEKFATKEELTDLEKRVEKLKGD